MLQRNKILLVFCFLFVHFFLAAQNRVNIKFGKIAATDFDLAKYKFDTSAAAIVIADIGDCHYEGNITKGLRLVLKRYRRVKILNRNGFDAATVMIPLFTKGVNGDKLRDLEANTYNLENGQVSTTKLDDKSIYTENYTQDIVLRKFTFPALKEGSIIEFSYTQESAVQIFLKPWDFQGKYPSLWSEYNVSIPEEFNYVTLAQGYNPYYINSTDNNLEYGFKATQHRWVIKDIPALKEESYTTTIKNYISRIEFQLSSIRTNGVYRSVLPDWKKVSENLMSSDNFGTDLTKNNSWLDDDLKLITQHTSSKLEKAQTIYAFVRDHFKCVQRETSNTNNAIKMVFKNKSGNEAEINLLLCAMLNHEGVQSSPILLSTRGNGFANEIYPMVTRLNYVICDAEIESSVYFLDASNEFLSFDHLPQDCYNGQAMIIDRDNPRPVYLIADSLKEKKLTTVFISNNEKNTQDISGSFQTNLGYYESFKLREKLSTTKQKDFFKETSTSFNPEIEIQNEGIDSLKLLEYPVAVHYDFTLKKAAVADILYFNPVMSGMFKENPFKSVERKYPVEMPFTQDESYVLDMEIPKGYIVDEMPKSARVLLNENEGFFEYVIDKSETNVQLRTRIKLNKANFEPEDYKTLRDFFALIVKKQSEQIVFKKKK
ncbi:MAG TPA: DUF3857 domain-containing protein [Puia sp.]|jgi:hypothetical protein|nr:DUF3857 domain-containing protein [Puia sp.]